jgi:hypothetical protein
MIISAEVNGLTDCTGHDDLLSFRLVYAESSEDFQKGDWRIRSHNPLSEPGKCRGACLCWQNAAPVIG